MYILWCIQMHVVNHASHSTTHLPPSPRLPPKTTTTITTPLYILLYSPSLRIPSKHLPPSPPPFTITELSCVILYIPLYPPSSSSLLSPPKATTALYLHKAIMCYTLYTSVFPFSSPLLSPLKATTPYTYTELSCFILYIPLYSPSLHYIPIKPTPSHPTPPPPIL